MMPAMAEGSFYVAEARARATDIVKEVESQTAAELVITVRRSSGHYRHADYLAGFALSFATLLGLLFLPVAFALWSFPVDVFVSFALGAAVASQSHTLQRLLSSTKLQRDNVARAARAAFVDLGVTKTTGRTGVLVYASMLERRAEVVADVGVDTVGMGAAWDGAVRAIDDAVRAGADFERFSAAVRALGPLLAGALPRQADDVNELPDEMVAS
jgi:putative membrane protein